MIISQQEVGVSKTNEATHNIYLNVQKNVTHNLISTDPISHASHLKHVDEERALKSNQQVDNAVQNPNKTSPTSLKTIENIAGSFAPEERVADETETHDQDMSIRSRLVMRTQHEGDISRRSSNKTVTMNHSPRSVSRLRHLILEDGSVERPVLQRSSLNMVPDLLPVLSRTDEFPVGFPTRDDFPCDTEDDGELRTMYQRHKSRSCNISTDDDSFHTHSTAENMSTDRYLMAMQRFAGRRSLPLTVYSDYVTTFRAANTELSDLFKTMQHTDVQHYCAHQGITWKFLPPRAAWWGGWWKRMIGLTEPICLRNVLGRSQSEISFTKFSVVISIPKETKNWRSCSASRGQQTTAHVEESCGGRGAAWQRQIRCLILRQSDLSTDSAGHPPRDGPGWGGCRGIGNITPSVGGHKRLGIVLPSAVKVVYYIFVL